jgi:hypothetical protein
MPDPPTLDRTLPFLCAVLFMLTHSVEGVKESRFSLCIIHMSKGKHGIVTDLWLVF